MSDNYVPVSQLSWVNTVKNFENQECAHLRSIHANEKDLSIFVVGLLWVVGVTISAYFMAIDEVGSFAFYGGLTGAAGTTFLCGILAFFCKYYANQKATRIGDSLTLGTGWVHYDDAISWIENDRHTDEEIIDGLKDNPEFMSYAKAKIKSLDFPMLLKSCETLKSIEEIEKALSKLNEKQRVDFYNFIVRGRPLKLYQKMVLYALVKPEKNVDYIERLQKLQPLGDRNKKTVKECIHKLQGQLDGNIMIYLSAYPESVAEYNLQHPTSPVFPEFDDAERAIFYLRFFEKADLDLRKKFYIQLIDKDAMGLALALRDFSPESKVEFIEFIFSQKPEDLFGILKKVPLKFFKFALQKTINLIQKQFPFDLKSMISLGKMLKILDKTRGNLLFENIIDYLCQMIPSKINLDSLEFSESLYRLMDPMSHEIKIKFFEALKKQNKLKEVFQTLWLEVPRHNNFDFSFFDAMKAFPEVCIESFGLAWIQTIKKNPKDKVSDYSTQLLFLHLTFLFSKKTQDRDLLDKCAVQTNGLAAGTPSFRDVEKAKKDKILLENLKAEKGNSEPLDGKEEEPIKPPPKPPKASHRKSTSADDLLNRNKHLATINES